MAIIDPSTANPITGTDVEGSDAWWLKRLYEQLRPQQLRCKALRDRFDGESPVPFLSPIQKQAVAWFVSKARTNYERIIVNAYLSRLRIRGIQTSAGPSDRGDTEAFKAWKKARGKLWTREVHEKTLVESIGFLIINTKPGGGVLVTAEDPQLVTVITDPSDPYKVVAGLKLMYDEVKQQDVAYLYLPGRVMVARKDRKRAPGTADARFNPRGWAWDLDIVNDLGDVVYQGKSGPVPWTQDTDSDGNVTGGIVPIVPFFNGTDPDHAQAQFEPFLHHIDRLNQQMLQRMTIATIQAFKQRAFKGLPKVDPETGDPINYDALFTADPGAIWSIPETAEIWESGSVDITPLVNSYRDDVKDLFAVSGTPGYLAGGDDVNASAEAASLKREMTVFGVEELQDRFELSHELACEMIFRALGDDQGRAGTGATTVIWAPAERLSMTERASAIAQTKGVISRYRQLLDIWGMDPDEADQTMSELEEDFQVDLQYAAGVKAAQSGPDVTTVTNNN